MKTKIILFFSLLIGFLGCKESGDPLCCDTFFDNEVIINNTLFTNTSKEDATIQSVEIFGDIVTITFSASGCDGNSWEVLLIDSEKISESNPPQRNLILSLENEELCDAYITKEISFDISKLKIEGVNKIQLNIVNSDDEILYEY